VTDPATIVPAPGTFRKLWRTYFGDPELAVEGEGSVLV
jgi:hypothetical protein